ncbi:MAG TPA: cupin domain-containing protein [Blastocatellia bacterium]|jgi:mannose-6-phosphate isomerase-like protein (cupin superfamily)
MILEGGAAVIPGGNYESLEGARRYRTPISRRMGARDISQTLSLYLPGHAPARRNPVAEEVLYVVRGSGACFINGFHYELSPGTACFVPPGSICQIETDAKSELEIVSVRCPEDDSEIVTESLERPEGITKPILTIQESARKSTPVGDRRFKLLAGQDLGAERVTQFIGVIPPGRAPVHHHTYEEAIYIIEGEGRLWAGGEGARFVAGSSIYLPRGVSHSLENTGQSNIKLLGVFHPSGSPAASYDD